MMRSILDFGMGLLIMVAGVFIFFRYKWELAINDKYPPDWLDKVLGGMFVLYGAWRIYRGYKKNYFG